MSQSTPSSSDAAQIGKTAILEVVEESSYGVYLDGGALGDILLPSRDVPEDCQIGDTVEAFIYLDSEDRLIATMQRPLAEVGEFALLKVVGVERVGAFLDWGLMKDLFLPFAEQTRDLRVGQSVLVHVYLDKSERISASMRLDRFLDKETSGYQEGQPVELMVAAKTDLGFKAIINGRHGGMLFSDEIFQELSYGQRVSGFIKQVRPDGKVDLSLQDPKKVGHHAADDIAPRILELLKAEGGFLAINDKTPAEEIYRLFGVSKKKYKIALGGLYKSRAIIVEEDGIRLV
jgi:hypothetical protein